MDRLQMLQQALRELPDASNEALAAFITEHFGVRVEARFISIWRASLLARKVQNQAKATAEWKDTDSVR